MNLQLQNHVKAVQVQSSLYAEGGLLQRKCTCGNHTIAGGECAECRLKREEMIQPVAMNTPLASVVPPIVHNVLRSAGQPLDTATRSFMEPHFNHDFSQVRVHTDEKAAESTQAVNALAYTVGRNIVFGIGQYAPGTIAGKRLLAHELTHVVQQGRQPISAQAKLQMNEPEDSFEQEADRVAAAITATASEVQEKFAGVSGPDGITSEEDPLIQSIKGRAEVQHHPINFLRLPILQRTANLVAGTVNAVQNPAEELATGGSAGITVPVLNGSRFIGDAQAKAAIHKPDIGGKSDPTGGVQCWVNTIPTNVGSFVENVMSNGPWSTVTTKANLGFRFGLPACVAAGSGNATFTAHGVPSDAAVAAANRRHENHHAADEQASFNEVVVPWDTAMTAAQSSQRKFAGADATACEAALFAAIGGTPDDIATNLWNSIGSKGDAFHSTPAGGPRVVTNATSDAGCNTATVDVLQ